MWRLAPACGAAAGLLPGPNGSDLTRDAGLTWQRISDTGFDAVQCTNDGACWASGTEGRVARLVR